MLSTPKSYSEGYFIRRCGETADNTQKSVPEGHAFLVG
jgi:hypothetical protein